MTRGITENDVWTASDALLLEGARPTIERVRQKIGRGSPNTVSPYLDTWFRNLGGRIKDPGAFSAPADVPEPIVQAAKHLWQIAQTESRRDFDQRLNDGMAAAVANVEAEKERATVAESATFEAARKAAHLQAELVERIASHDHDRIGRAAAEARLQDARQQIENLQVRADRVESEVAEVRDSSSREIAAAVDRSAASERRAALSIDVERVTRAKAEKRAEHLERRLEAATAEAHHAVALQTENAITKRAELARLNNELACAAVRDANLTDEVARLTALVVAEQRAAERARGEATAARSLLLEFNGLIATAESARKPLRAVTRGSDQKPPGHSRPPKAR